MRETAGEVEDRGRSRSGRVRSREGGYEAVVISVGQLSVCLSVYSSILQTLESDVWNRAVDATAGSFRKVNSPP